MSMFKPDKPDTTIDVDIPLVLERSEPLPISVITLAAELGEPIDDLVRRLGADVFVEAQTGLRCVAVETCRREVDERDRRVAAIDRLARERYDALAAEDAARRVAVDRSDPHLTSLALNGFGGRR